MRVTRWQPLHMSLLALLLLSLAPPPALAAPIEAITEASSYSYLDEGKVAGPASEVVKATLEQAGLKDYHLALYPWARAYHIARAEPNVLIYPIIRTAERERLFKWVGEFEEIKTVLYRLQGHEGLELQDLDQAKAHTVGVVRDDVRDQYLRNAGFTRLVVSASALDNLRKLLAGQVDLIPLSPQDAQRFCEQLHIPFYTLKPVMGLEQITAHAYMAFSLATPDEVVQKAVDGFNLLKRQGKVRRLMAP